MLSLWLDTTWTKEQQLKNHLHQSDIHLQRANGQFFFSVEQLYQQPLSMGQLDLGALVITNCVNDILITFIFQYY